MTRERRPLTTTELGCPMLDALGVDYRDEPILEATLTMRGSRFPTLTIKRLVRSSAKKFRRSVERYELHPKALKAP